MMSKVNIAALEKQVKRIIDRIAKMSKSDCVGGCGRQPHQQISGDLVCWRCGSY